MVIHRRNKDSTDKRPRPAPQNKSDLRYSLWSVQRTFTFLVILSLVAFVVYFRLSRRSGSVHSSVVPGTAFVVADLPGKGKGLVALRVIKQGELILREKPLFVVPPKISSSPTSLIWSLLSQLNEAERNAFHNLSYVNFPEDLSPESHPAQLALAKFQTNAVATGDSVGVFPLMARLNHGCSRAFNVVYSWRDHEGVLVVHALRTIQKGEELLTTYTNTKRAKAERRKYLAEHYAFHCTCEACSLPEPQSRQSDERLTTMSALSERLGTWVRAEVSGIEAIDLVNKIWKVGEEEGYWSERGRLAADAVWVAAAHSDADSASKWAQLSTEWYRVELGGVTTRLRLDGACRYTKGRNLK